MTTEEPTIACPACGTALAAPTLTLDQFQACPSCAVLLQGMTFPALAVERKAIHPTPALLVGTDASCFHHPGKPAAAICDSCGRFICKLCEFEESGKRLCPTCLNDRLNQPAESTLVRNRILYDSTALFLALAPILIWPITVVTAPAALFLSFYAWKKPGSLLRRSRIRLVLAAIFALLQIIGWVILLIVLLGSRDRLPEN